MYKLEVKRDLLLEKLAKCSYFAKGSITSVCMTCNRVNCICKHPKGNKSYRLTYKDSNQKTRIVYVSNDRVKEVRKMIANYKKYKDISDEIIDINIKIFKEGGQG